MPRYRHLVLASILATFAASNVPGQGFRPRPSVPETRTTYGTTVESYYRVAASEFTPLALPATYSDQFFQNPGSLYLSRFGTSGEVFVAAPHLPSGAQLTYLELDNCDFNDGFQLDVYLSLLDCDYSGYCGTSAIRSISSANNATLNACSYVATDLSDLGLTVNNYGRQLSLLVTTPALDASTSFSGVILGYRLQVAPAPATPTFNDVPTSDFGFQYIEALNLWGITGGCGGGAYCPDSPVTRRQMAIFIAKALGLYLQQY